VPAHIAQGPAAQIRKDARAAVTAGRRDRLHPMHGRPKPPVAVERVTRNGFKPGIVRSCQIQTGG
jgi:hypothetical protein